MALETATNILTLAATNPTAGDPKSQGDDHLRLLKTVLQSEFTPYSHGTSGYAPLPGGLILQWGQASIGSTGSTVTFGKAFPTAAYTVIATSASSSSTIATWQLLTTTNVFVQTWTTAGAGVAAVVGWVAIGK